MSSPTRLPNIAQGKLTAQPLDAVPQFNWVFLVELIVCGILTLFFLFYFNRLFATLLSYGIRAYTWHYYRIYIDIHALQISLLGGRIFFKGVQYHGENETILVQWGYITWKYWLRSVRDTELIQERTRQAGNDSCGTSTTSQRGNGRSPEYRTGKTENIKKKNQRPCRIEITLHGVEWFVYNRSAAYDTILDGFRSSTQTNPHDVKNEVGEDKRGSMSIQEVKEPQVEVSNKQKDDFQSGNQKDAPTPQSLPESDSVCDLGADLKLPKFLSLLPVWVNCYKGALVVGNEHTKSILAATFERGFGKIDAGNSGPLDIFKQIFEFELLHPVVQLKPNPDFKHSQLAAAKSMRHDTDTDQQSRRQRLHWAVRHRRKKLWNNLRDLIPYFQRSVESFRVHQGSNQPRSTRSLFDTLPGESHWLGLTRYLDEESRNEHEGWNAVEYGRFSTILDCPSITVRYHWDIPGRVLAQRIGPASSVRRMLDDINGAEPPEWGIHLSVKGGMINYGPWADRERANLQAILFPNPYRDSQAASPLSLGQWRQSTKFTFTVDFKDQTNLRIPTREPSKDWIWKGRAEVAKGASKTKNQKEKKHPRGKEGDKGSHGPDIRPFGWLALVIERGSKLDYQMDMVATQAGYCNKLVLDLQGSKLTSSVNHGVLWHSGRQKISCDLSNPLEWNTLHTWSFAIDSNDLELFLIRDHIFLLTDLVNDWTSGPFPEFYTFVPFQYDIRLSFTGAKLFLNVNDSNIINNPTDTDDNSFLIIKPESLVCNVRIPTVNYRPKRNAIPFDLTLSNATMEFSVPLWNTHRSFLDHPSIASLDSLSMKGNYDFNTLTSPTLTDVLTLDLTGSSPELYLYGFVVNTFLKVKENYFGENLHFRTLEEFQELANPDNPPLSNTVLSKSNDLDVILHIHADFCKVLLPSNIYDRLNCVCIEAASLDTDVRFTNYYMDLQASFSPLAVSLRPLRPDDSPSQTELFIDGLSIYGHRLFGLPPTEPTYVCNWDFDVGRIMGECSVDFVRNFMSALKSFIYSIDDEENSLPPLHPIVLYDVIFLRAKVESIKIWVLLSTTACLFSSGTLDLDFNDWAGPKFSEHLNLSLLDITFAVVDQNSSARVEKAYHPVRTYAYVHTSVSARMVERKANFVASRDLQQHHVRTHDRRTQRTPWLLWNDKDDSVGISKSGDKQTTAAMSVPSMPLPIREMPGFIPDAVSILSSDFASQYSTDPIKGSMPPFRYEEKSGLNGYPQGLDHSLAAVPHSALLSPNADSLTSRSTRPRRQVSLESESRSVLDKDYFRKMATPKKGLASAWLAPTFRSHKMVLDLSDLPPLPSLDDFNRTEDNGDGESDIFSGETDVNVTQTYFLLDLISGLKGFCHPEAFFSVATLLENFQPVHPIEVLDDLQSAVVSDILSHTKRLARPRRVTNLSLQLPVCRVKLLNTSSTLKEHGTLAPRDQLDLQVLKMRALLSSKSESEKDAVKDKQMGMTMHLKAQSLSLSAITEVTEVLGDSAIFHFIIEDIVFWSVADKAIRSRMQVEDINLVFQSESVQHLPSFVRRASTLVTSVIPTIKGISISRAKRLHSLIYHLTKFGSQTPDPQFLTRPSYVLRAAEEHLRVNDSWKILSRLRNIFKSLPDQAAQQLISNCVKNIIPCPQDPRSIVLSSFDKWRTWDLAHVKKSYVMNVVWGPDELASSHISDDSQKDISLFVHSIRVSLDPLASVDLLMVDKLSTLIEMKPSFQRESPKRTLTIQNYCSDISIKLRWELIRVLEEGLDAILEVFPQTSGSVAESDGTASKNDLQAIHVLLVADNASTILDGINLRIALLGNALKTSICHQSESSGQPGQSNVLFAAETSTAEFTSRAKGLMLWTLISPNIYLSHSSTKNNSDTIHDWKCSAQCQSLRYDMAEDPVGLIQVADRLVEDEVKHILRLTAKLGLSDEPQLKQKDHSIHQCHITTFLDDYELYLMLLPTTAYVISGDVVRLSLAPAAESRLEVDFDIKSSTHSLRSSKDGRERVISSLTIPPINGRVVKSSLNGQTALDIYSTIELIKVDADSVRNILGAISGPEISHFVSDLQDDLQILKENISQVVPRRSAPPNKQPSTESLALAYKLRLTLAGINVHSSAPSLQIENSFADMDLGLGIVQINLESQDFGSDLPQLDVSFSQVIFDLRRRQTGQIQSFGNLDLCAQLSGTSNKNDRGESVRYYHLSSKCLQIELSAETASMMVDIATHLQERLKTLDMSQEIKHLRKLRRIRSRRKSVVARIPKISVAESTARGGFLDAIYSVDLSNIQLSWLISSCTELPQGREAEDLVFSIKRIELATGRQSVARLRIQDMQLQMVPLSDAKQNRSQNSALLPEAVFDVAYLALGSERRFAFQAAGKVLDIRMTSDFILPASILQRSLASASESLREAKFRWQSDMPSEEQKKTSSSHTINLSSLLVDADFAGAVVSLQGRNYQQDENNVAFSSTHLGSSGGKYGQYSSQDAVSVATLRAPGVAIKVQFENTDGQDPTLNAEIKVAASCNVLHPTIVLLITEITASVKEVVGESNQDGEGLHAQVSEKGLQAKAIGANDPTTILGRCKLNMGLRICKQEFTLSCQPIARVAASARFDDSYITVNTVQSAEQRRFFAVLIAFNKFQASIKHVYSSESTASFDIDSIVVSMMNSKHVSSSSGISAILKISPMRLQINAKQMQDFMLFQEIWMAPDSPTKSQKVKASSPEGQAYIVQQYQQMASAEAFPWNSTIAIEQLDVQLDLGQTLGKSEFTITNLWLSSKKSSDWEQNLCVGFETASIKSIGRLSGFVELSQFKVRTSIEWIDGQNSAYHTPLIQAAVGFSRLQSKVSFEYQPFLVADVSSFNFLMYNVRDTSEEHSDRLVSILEGGKLQVFCTTLTASQGLALFQTLQRLIQDKQAAYEASLKEIEGFIRRKSTLGLVSTDQEAESTAKSDYSEIKMPISLQTNVVVRLEEIKIGTFPSTFQDSQIFKLEALDAEARFSVAIQSGKIHSGLGLTLGQLRVALSSVNRPTEVIPEELPIDEIVSRATSSRGGTILKVPRLVATMETWQLPTSNHIDYIFKSSFEGKVDVGWNYSRIAFIRGMWDTHSRALANRLGKPLPQAAVQITGGPQGDDGEYSGQEKITAVVNVPQSRYTYTALETPVIETPQLRDMGEATPPLEWIGLHRDKLPNITHQIIIVTLMEVAKDVEDAYSKILGS
ncbi:fermentation associated protein [Coccidioides immitis RS]|uniref:Fermentation associated protein n=2 Tax=Coccidioides immitis TaxID=5501 RepID=J3KES1_COCIM|nr:fermentation associated protein [Coccidioides immitis RS]EAS34009.3 fermentation associated protein [Coccidioides immitis RS]